MAKNKFEAIQVGLYYGTAGSIKELCYLYQKNVFHGEDLIVIGTGGFARIFNHIRISCGAVIEIYKNISAPNAPIPKANKVIAFLQSIAPSIRNSTTPMYTTHFPRMNNPI